MQATEYDIGKEGQECFTRCFCLKVFWARLFRSAAAVDLQHSCWGAEIDGKLALLLPLQVLGRFVCCALKLIKVCVCATSSTSPDQAATSSKSRKKSNPPLGINPDICPDMVSEFVDCMQRADKAICVESECDFAIRACEFGPLYEVVFLAKLRGAI